MSLQITGMFANYVADKLQRIKNMGQYVLCMRINNIQD